MAQAYKYLSKSKTGRIAIPTGSGISKKSGLETSAGRGLFAERQYGPASAIVPAFVERLSREEW